MHYDQFWDQWEKLIVFIPVRSHSFASKRLCWGKEDWVRHRYAQNTNPDASQIVQHLGSNQSFSPRGGHEVMMVL